MSVKSVLLIIVFLLTFVVSGQVGLAGTWIDDFSDRTLEDWDGTWGFKNDEFNAGVNDGRFNFRGKKDNAKLSLTNWKVRNLHDFTLEMKFMIRRLPAPPAPEDGRESYWKISYEAFNEETHEHEGFLEFEFRHALGDFKAEDVLSFMIVRGVLEEHPEIGRIWRGHVVASAHFIYEKEVWYTLKIEAHGNRYTFWVGDFALEALDDSVPAGRIGLNFVGRCNIWLDDFSVTGPNVPDGGPGFPRAVLPAEKIATTWGKLKSRD